MNPAAIEKLESKLSSLRHELRTLHGKQARGFFDPEEEDTTAKRVRNVTKEIKSIQNDLRYMED